MARNPSSNPKFVEDHPGKVLKVEQPLRRFHGLAMPGDELVVAAIACSLALLVWRLGHAARSDDGFRAAPSNAADCSAVTRAGVGVGAGAGICVPRHS
jgi:hypothetical protein